MQILVHYPNDNKIVEYKTLNSKKSQVTSIEVKHPNFR